MSFEEHWPAEANYPPDLYAERTEWTEPMKQLVMGLKPANARATDLGAELRVVLPATGRRFSFLGQTPSHGLQGANPERIAFWKRREPVTFVAIQGDVGWLLIVREETPTVWIDKTAGHRRVGWRCAEMLKVAFTAEAFDRHESSKQPAVMWRWDLTHELKTPEGLF